MQTEEELLQQGDQADALLSSDAFNNVVNTLVEESFQRFVNSKAEEVNEREQSYSHYRALVSIVNALQQRVSVRDEIMKERESNDSDNNGEE